MRTTLFSMLLLGAFAIMLAGCLQVEDTYTINPDGSGKVAINATVQRFDFGESTEGKSKKQQVNDYVQKVLESSEGVDVWKDVSCKMLEDGKIVFKGTAYFSDISELNLEEVATTKFALRTDTEGRMILVPREAEESADGAMDPGTDTPESRGDLSDAEIAVIADSLKEQFKMGRSMMALFIADMREHSTIKLPGSVQEAAGFSRNADGSVMLKFEGTRLLEILDSVTAADGFWREQVIAEANGRKANREREMAKLMFGAESPRVVVAAGAKPLFNYSAEVAAAKKKFPALRKQFGIKSDSF